MDNSRGNSEKTHTPDVFELLKTLIKSFILSIYLLSMIYILFWWKFSSVQTIITHKKQQQPPIKDVLSQDFESVVTISIDILQFSKCEPPPDLVLSFCSLSVSLFAKNFAYFVCCLFVHASSYHILPVAKVKNRYFLSLHHIMSVCARFQSLIYAPHFL